MTKKITIGAKPTAAKDKPAPSVDEWVQNRALDGVKRVTIDIPKSLHTQIRIGCLMRGTNMADELRSILVEHYKNTPLPQQGISNRQ